MMRHFDDRSESANLEFAAFERGMCIITINFIAIVTIQSGSQGRISKFSWEEIK